MKKITLSIVIILIMVLSNFRSNGQVDIVSHAGLSTYYVGWNAAQAYPLNITHNAAQPINFLTNSIQQMTILGSGNVGFVGIGKSFTSPASLLSVDGTNNPTGEVFRTNCPSGTTTIWRMIRAGNEYGSFFSGVDSNFYKKKTILRSFC